MIKSFYLNNIVYYIAGVSCGGFCAELFSSRYCFVLQD